MTRSLLKIALAISLLFGAAMTPVALTYASSGTDQANSTLDIVKNQAGGKDVNSLSKTIISTMLFIVGILAVVMIIYSGIRYITAHGDKSQVESAKNTLIYSIVGLVVAIVAYAVVSFVISRL